MSITMTGVAALFSRDGQLARQGDQGGLARSALELASTLVDVPIFSSFEEDKRKGEEAAICPNESVSVDAPSRIRRVTKMSTSLVGGMASVVGGLASGSPKIVISISVN